LRVLSIIVTAGVMNWKGGTVQILPCLFYPLLLLPVSWTERVEQFKYCLACFIHYCYCRYHELKGWNSSNIALRVLSIIVTAGVMNWKGGTAQIFVEIF